MLAALAMVSAGGIGWWLTLPAVNPRLAETATRFTMKVLQGENEDAQSLVATNQGADFRQWVRMDVARSLDSASMQGNARLSLRLKDQKDGLVWLEAEVSGVGRNKNVVLLQGWRPVLGGHWRFDAAQTVSRTRTDPPVRQSGRRMEGDGL